MPDSAGGSEFEFAQDAGVDATGWIAAVDEQCHGSEDGDEAALAAADAHVSWEHARQELCWFRAFGLGREDVSSV